MRCIAHTHKKTGSHLRWFHSRVSSCKKERQIGIVSSINDIFSDKRKIIVIRNSNLSVAYNLFAAVWCCILDFHKKIICTEKFRSLFCFGVIFCGQLLFYMAHTSLAYKINCQLRSTYCWVEHTLGSYRFLSVFDIFCGCLSTYLKTLYRAKNKKK